MTINDKNDIVDDVITPLNSSENCNKRKKSKRVNSYMNIAKPPIPFYSLKSVRLRICLLSMLGLFVSTSMRVSLNMAVVCMVNSTAYQLSGDDNNSSSTSLIISSINDDKQCSKITLEEEESKGYHGTFLWTSNQQSMLLSASFYGGIITVSFAGLMADKFGPKLTLFIGVFTAMIISYLTPLLAENSFYGFFIGRFIMGIGEGFIFPSMTSMVARWIPKTERSTSVAMTTSGNQLATIFGLWFSSLLCGTDILGGWPLIFYFFATISAIWCLFWLTNVTNSPCTHKNISQEELLYLQEQLETQSIVQKNGSNKLYSNPIPWIKIFTSIPILTNIFAQFVYTFSLGLLQTYLPQYLKQILKVELSKNGFYSMLPFLSQLISKNLVAMLSDYLKKNGYVTNTTGCKIFQIISNIGSAFCFLILGYYIDCSSLILTVATLLLYGALFSAGVCGFFTSQLSIAPQYTGLLFSISRLASIAGGAISINFAGYINQHGTLDEWRIIWLTGSILNVFTAFVYFFFSSSDIQPWAKNSSNNNSNETTTTDLEKDIKLEKI